MQVPPELHDLDRFRSTSMAQRQDISRGLAASLGSEWEPASLVGSAELCCLLYRPLGLEFVVVPGGRFRMGLRDDDLEEIEKHLDLDDPEVEAFLDLVRQDASPVREVQVLPHLFARRLLTTQQVKGIDPAMQTDEVLLDEAWHLASSAGFRLPSEAEYEWAVRDGGSLHFTYDIAAAYKGDYLTGLDIQGAFGILDLLSSQWVADDPHDSYKGAPATSAPWWDGDAPRIAGPEDGIRRGALATGVEQTFDLLYCLAALRSGGDLTRLRPARSL